MKIIVTLLFAICFSSYSIAGEEHSHDHDHSHDDHSHDEHEEEFDDHAAHAHGFAQANITRFEQITKISFVFPAIDIFGFEHRPNDESEIKIAKNKLSLLSNPDEIFTIQPECTLLDSYVDSEMTEHLVDDHDHNHHESKHEHEHASHEEESHFDVSANYELKCTTDNEIQITFELLNTFPSIEKLQVNYISENGQAAPIITAKEITYDFP